MPDWSTDQVAEAMRLYREGELSYEYGVLETLPDGREETVWRGPRIFAEQWMAGCEEARLVRRRVVHGPPEEVPTGA